MTDVIREAFLKHRPGGQDHDQDKHGKKGMGLAAESPVTESNYHDLSVERKTLADKVKASGNTDREAYLQMNQLDAQMRAIIDERKIALDAELPEDDHKMQHQPSGTYGAPLHDMGQLVSDDIYTHPEWYFSMGEDYNKQGARIMQDVRGKPDTRIEIYRAVPKGVQSEIEYGDWVTTVRDYAQIHGESNVSSGYDIISATVPVKDLMWPGDSMVEYGWFPGNEGFIDKRFMKHYPGGQSHNQQNHAGDKARGVTLYRGIDTGPQLPWSETVTRYAGGTPTGHLERTGGFFSDSRWTAQIYAGMTGRDLLFPERQGHVISVTLTPEEAVKYRTIELGSGNEWFLPEEMVDAAVVVEGTIEFDDREYYTDDKGWLKYEVDGFRAGESPSSRDEFAAVRERFAKHYPGGQDHDQSNHGRRNTGTAADVPKPGRLKTADINTEVQRILEEHYPDRQKTESGWMVECWKCEGKGGREMWPGFTCWQCWGSGKAYRSDTAIRRMAADNLKRNDPSRKAWEEQEAQRKLDDSKIAFAENHPKLEATMQRYLDGDFVDNDFITSVMGQGLRNGQLSEKQAASVPTAVVRNDEYKAQQIVRDTERAALPPYPTGRTSVKGKVISSKWQDSQYGSTFKMLVEMEDGNRVWGTVPSSISHEVSDHTSKRAPLEGDLIIEFDAAFEVSRDDEHFGFYKRPTKASVVRIEKHLPGQHDQSTHGSWAGGLTVKDYDGRVGERSHITRSAKGVIATSHIAQLRGVQGEVPGEHRNRLGERWEEFKADIATNGMQSPIFITVDYGEAPKISEGNHRRDAAVELGLPEVPVHIRFFGMAEWSGEIAKHTPGGVEHDQMDHGVKGRNSGRSYARKPGRSAEWNEIAERTTSDDFKWDSDEGRRYDEITAGLFKEKEAWSAEIQDAISIGDITPEEADSLDFNPPRDDPWVDLTDKTMYHATNAHDAIMAGGFKTREELTDGSGTGLGGGASDTISFTTDKAMAETIRDTMVEMHAVVNGEVTIEDMLARAKAGDEGSEPFFDKWMGSKNYEHLKRFELGDRRKLHTGVSGYKEYAAEKLAASQPDADPSTLVGNPGTSTNKDKTAFVSWSYQATPQQMTDTRVEMYKQFLGWREHAGGPTDPLFFSANTTALAAMDPKQFQVIEVKGKPGTRGRLMGSLKEIRVFTPDVFDIVSPDIATAIQKHRPGGKDHDQKNHGRRYARTDAPAKKIVPLTSKLSWDNLNRTKDLTGLSFVGAMSGKVKEADRVKAKDSAISAIADRIRNKAVVKEYAAALASSALDMRYPDDAVRSFVDLSVDGWASTDEDDTGALHIAVADEFGLVDESFHQTTGQRTIDGLWTLGGEVDKSVGREAHQVMARAIYDETQANMKGVKEVVLFRGLTADINTRYIKERFNKWHRGYKDTWHYSDTLRTEGPEYFPDLPHLEGGVYGEDFPGLLYGDVELAGSPVASWSASYNVARSFAQEGIVLAAVVPKEAVFSTAFTGHGALHEDEVTVLDHGKNIVTVIPINQTKRVVDSVKSYSSAARKMMGPWGASFHLTTKEQNVSMNKAILTEHRERGVWADLDDYPDGDAYGDTELEEMIFRGLTP